MAIVIFKLPDFLVLIYLLKFFVRLSILFLLLLSPIFILAIIFILIEDGFPIFSLEQSIGWDGRRFVVYKLRIFKNDKLGKNIIKDRSYIKILNIGRIFKKIAY